MELQSSSRKHSLEISWNDDRGSILGTSSSRWWLSRPVWKMHVLQIGANRLLVSWSSQANRIWKHADRVYHGLPNVIHAGLTPIERLRWSVDPVPMIDQATGSFRVSSLRIIWMTSDGVSVGCFNRGPFCGALHGVETSFVPVGRERSFELFECSSWPGLFSWGLKPASFCRFRKFSH